MFFSHTGSTVPKHGNMQHCLLWAVIITYFMATQAAMILVGNCNCSFLFRRCQSFGRLLVPWMSVTKGPRLKKAPNLDQAFLELFAKLWGGSGANCVASWCIEMHSGTQMLYPLLGFPPKDGCKETSFPHAKQIRHIVGTNNCQNTICSFRMRFHS